MSTEHIETPESDQKSVQQDKKERNHNGLYRRNSRLKKIKDSASNAPEEISQEEQTKVIIRKKRNDKATNPNAEKTPVKTKKKTTKTVKKEEAPQEKNPSSSSKSLGILKKHTKPMSEEQVQKMVDEMGGYRENISNDDNDDAVDIPEKITTENIPEIIEEPVITSRSVFHELLYLARQRNAYNHNAFFLELEKVLTVMPFDKIKESNLSLFGFACMYDREIIFQNLCEHYSEFITQEDFESIVKFCFSKREETLGNLIKVYNERFKPSSEFIKSLFKYMGISSYRENNNIQLLEWVAPYLQEEEYEIFWDTCIEYRNFSLMTTALHVLSIKEHLQKNYNKYIDKFKLIGKEHTMTEDLKKEFRKIKINPVIISNVSILSKTYLADNKEQLKSLQQDDTKQPVVIFKTPRKNADS